MLTRVPLLVSLCLAGCAGSDLTPAAGPGDLQRFERVEPAMGTRFRIVLYAGDATTAQAALEGAFARIAALDARLSDYLPDSELSELGHSTDGPDAPGALAVSADLARVLAGAGEITRLSDGAFDVTLGPYTRLWRRARRQAELPSARRLAAAAAAVGWARLGFDARAGTVTPSARGMRLDLGGIAKGFALDEALAELRARGIERALIDGGGDVLCGRAPPGRAGWRVALQGFDRIDAALTLEHRALATSGDLERFVELDGRRFSHLIDPRTGQAIEERRLVSVLAPSGMRADALASAVSVLGSATGIALLESLADAAGRVVVRGPAGDAVSSTPGFDQALSCDE